MSIRLADIYEDILKKYGCKLMTSGFFDREVKWVHVQEERDFLKYLRGGEFIMNSTMNLMNDEERKDFIKGLRDQNAAGCLMATRDVNKLNSTIVEFCEAERFPIIWCDYDVPFLDIMHELIEIIVYEQRNAMNREVALRNIILYHGKDRLHAEQIENDPFFEKKDMCIVVVGTEDDSSVKDLKSNGMPLVFLNSVECIESNRHVFLTTGRSRKELLSAVTMLHNGDSSLKIAIGTKVNSAYEIYDSYKAAIAAYRMIPVVGQNPLSYTNMGIYRFLDDVQVDNANSFIELTLGKLIKYDKEKGTDYVEILRAFMKNECNVIQTAEVLYFHRNTVKKRISKINEILGYDIMLNENRFRIILALYLRKIARNK